MMMEKWQLAGIISGNSSPKLKLPNPKLRKSVKKPKSVRPNTVGSFLQQTIRKMTEVIALF